MKTDPQTIRQALQQALAGDDLMPGDRAALQAGLDRLDRTTRMVLADDSELVAALTQAADRETSIPDAIAGFAGALNRALDILIQRGVLSVVAP